MKPDGCGHAVGETASYRDKATDTMGRASSHILAPVDTHPESRAAASARDESSDAGVSLAECKSDSFEV